MKLSDIQRQAQESLKKGMDFTEAQKTYGMSLGMFKKLGGKPKEKLINRQENKYLEIVCGKDRRDPFELLPELDEELVLGTVLGDGHVCLPTGGVNSHLMIGHCWEQIGYVKLKYELMKPFISKILLYRPLSIDQELEGPQSDYSLHINTKTSKQFNFFYDLFYTEARQDKHNPHKDILKEYIAKRVSWKTLAFWIMDDGKKNSTCPGVFSISYRKQPWYSYGKSTRFVSILSENLGIELYLGEDKDSFTIHNKKESAEKALVNLTQHFWPDMHYKLGVLPDVCGSKYRKFDWFNQWDLKREGLRHPFFDDFDIKSYKNCEEERLRKRFLRSLFSHFRATGFPWGRLSEEERCQEWQRLKNNKTKVIEKTLRVDTSLSRLPNHFSPYRFKTSVEGNASPYEVFHDKKKLKSILEKRANVDTGVSQNRMRNILCHSNYRSVGQFNPAFVRYFSNLYCKGNEILDPCAGWGGRMFGTASVGKNYYGIEPSSLAIPQLEEARKWIYTVAPSLNIDIIKGVAEDPVNYGNKLFDMAITSPPYFNKERYSNELTQSYIKFPSPSKWLEGFLSPLINNVYNHLKVGSYFILNIDDYQGIPLTMSAIRYALKLGFKMEDNLWGCVGSRSTNKVKALDNFIVLKKE